VPDTRSLDPKIFQHHHPDASYCKTDLRIFGDKEFEGTMFRELQWRSALKDLLLTGGLSLTVCALAAMCVLGLLSALAANLGSKARTNNADQASSNTRAKVHGPRLASQAERRAAQRPRMIVSE
jgi:hypothetical protein